MKGFYNKLLQSVTQSKREDLQNFFQDFQNNPVCEKEGIDKELRPVFISAQQHVETVLANMLKFHNTLSKDQKIESAVAIVHTPSPSTPLRKAPLGNIKEFLDTPGALDNIDHNISNDPKRLQTILDRQVSTRRILETPGGRIALLYMEGNETEYFTKNIKPKYTNSLVCKTCSEEKFKAVEVGASIIINFANGETMYWDIRTTQSTVENNRNWCMAMGDAKHPKIESKMQQTIAMLTKAGVDIEKELETSKLQIIEQLKQKESPQTSIAL